MNSQLILTLVYFITTEFTNYNLYKLLNPEKYNIIKRKNKIKEYIARYK